MKLHFLQHVPFEDLAYIFQWAQRKNVQVSNTPLYESIALPEQSQFDILVIMGGPMGIYDEQDHPWLKVEKKFIEQSIAAGKPTLGICLGAQLIASVAGAKVRKNDQPEIGFFDVVRSETGSEASLFKSIPQTFKPFHWHGDTFDIPDCGVHLCSSDACKNQAFQISDRVLGLQFHLESTQASINKLVENCADELIDAPFVHTGQKMLTEAGNVDVINPYMDAIMDNMVAVIK